MPFPLYQISHTPLGVRTVTWAPDGQHLVFEMATSKQTMHSTITTPVIVNRSGNAAWSPLIVGNSLCTHSYQWSPDGTQLTYVRDSQLHLADANGNTVRTLPPPADRSDPAYPHFSPDGQMIAVLVRRLEDNRRTVELWAYDVATGRPSMLIEDAGWGGISWSPSGDAVALLGQDNRTTDLAIAWIAELSGAPPVSAELDPLPGAEGCLEAPQWIGSGDRILAHVLLRPNVWLVDRRGQATLLEPSQESSSPGESGSDNFGRTLVSPDGRFVLFDAREGGAHVLNVATNKIAPMPSFEVRRATWSPTDPHFLTWDPGAGGAPLSLVDATTGSEQEFDSDGSWPSWSPDGRRIAYWKFAEDGMDLWLKERGNDPVRLTSVPRENPEQSLDSPHTARFSYDVTPRWSPDGTALAFVSWTGSRPEAHVLELE